MSDFDRNPKYYVEDIDIDEDGLGYSSFNIQTKADMTAFIVNANPSVRSMLDGRCEYFFKIHYNLSESDYSEGPWIQVVFQAQESRFGSPEEYEEFMVDCENHNYAYEGEYFESSVSDPKVFSELFRVNPELYVFACGEMSDDCVQSSVLADFAGDIGRGYLNNVKSFTKNATVLKESTTFADMELSDVNKVLLEGYTHIGRVDEGIETYRKGDGKMGVRITDAHQKGVDTGDPHNPSVFVSDVDKELVVYSIFKRTNLMNGHPDRDGNPLVYGLKREYDWEISEEDRKEILRRVSLYIRQLPKKVDVVISVPSSNPLNTEISKVIADTLNVPLVENGSFCKLTKEKFFDMHPVDEKAIEEDGLDVDQFYYELENVWCTSETDYFRFHDIPVKMRKYISVPPYYFPERNMLALAKEMNGKNVMVVDDTVTTGASLKYACQCIVGTFDVKTLTYVTLFSPKNMGEKYRKPKNDGMTIHLIDFRKDLKY